MCVCVCVCVYIFIHVCDDKNKKNQYAKQMLGISAHIPVRRAV